MSISLKRILWPTDFSPLSLHGGKYADALRRQFQAELHILYVIPTPLLPDASGAMMGELPITLNEPELLGIARKHLDKLVAEQLGGDESIRRESFFGNPWLGICDYAQKNEIDMIVIATHGRTGISYALIGSTAEKIVRHAPCPVLTVKLTAKK